MYRQCTQVDTQTKRTGRFELKVQAPSTAISALATHHADMPRLSSNLNTHCTGTVVRPQLTIGLANRLVGWQNAGAVGHGPPGGSG